MREIGLQGDSVTLLVAGGIGIVQFLAVFPTIIYIDRLGMSQYIIDTAHVLISLPARSSTITPLGKRSDVHVSLNNRDTGMSPHHHAYDSS